MDATFWVGPPADPDSYQLLTPIGGGGPGTGQVWRGVRPLPGVSWQEDVALKVVPALTGADPSAEQAWVGYGNRLMRLNHPGLARVVDVFSGPWMHRQGEQPPSSWARYLVMNLVEGTALSRWLAENPGAPLSARIAMLAPVAAALDEMHSGRVTQGPLAHGDVKPSNMILRPDGSVVLVDLGTGPRSDSGPATGRMDPYAAPELRAQGAQPTPESDAFAFAAGLAHMIIGQPPPVDPYGYLDVPALERILAGHPATYRRPALARQILAPLAARPEARPALLSQWLAGAGDAIGQVAPEPSAYPGPAPVAPAPKRRHTAAWIALVLAIIALLIAGYAVGVLTRPKWIADLFNPDDAGVTTVHVTETSDVTETSPPITETVTTQPSTPDRPTRTTPSTPSSETTSSDEAPTS